jgi:hypothetical protein
MVKKKKPESAEANSEMGLLDVVAEKLRKGQAVRYNKNPKLLFKEIKEIIQQLEPGVMEDCQKDESGKMYLAGVFAGIMVDRFGVSFETADEAISQWNDKQVKQIEHIKKHLII